LGLTDTKLGMILLYTAVNVSLAVWLLKGFIDEIPREYEEAAMVDGYSRLQAFLKVVLPQAATGIAATAIFCLIFAWNEYAFAVLLTSGQAQTMPPFIPFIIDEGGQDWPAVAAATTLFMIPIVGFTVLLRKHLLRGITFGAVRGSTFAVPDGAFFVILGPSGCGKTTTLRMIAGLELPSSGRIVLGGEDVTTRRASARDIAFVFQLFALYPHMNVRRNIAYPLKCEGIGAAETDRRVVEAARILRISHLLDRPVSGLAGGDRQRVALGRAIV